MSNDADRNVQHKDAVNRSSSILDHLAEDVNNSGPHLICSRNEARGRRLLWLIVLLGVVSGMAYMQIIRLQLFLSDPKSVNINVQYSQEVSFPTVTICNLNINKKTELYFMEQALLNKTEWWPFQTYPTNLLQFIVDYYNLVSAPDIDGRLDKFIEENRHYFEFNETIYIHTIQEATGHRLDDMLFRCTFNGKSCGPDSFQKIFTDGGPCYVFNGDPDKVASSSLAGKEGGLTMALDIQQSEYVPLYPDGAGIKILLHDQSYRISLTQAVGLQASVGEMTNIAIQQTRMEELPDGPNHCDLQEELVTCLSECTGQYVISQCGCRDYFLTGNASICDLTQMINCSFLARANLTSRPDFVEICPCTPKCTRSMFGAIVSSARLPHSWATRLSLEHKQPEQLESSLRLQDYMYINNINRSWSDELYAITKAYESIRSDVIGSLDVLQSLPPYVGSTQSPRVPCIDTSIDAYTTAVEQFKVWEKQTFFMEYVYITRHLENFQSRLAYDIRRDQGHYATFTEEFTQQVQLLNGSIQLMASCVDNATSSLVANTTYQIGQILAEAMMRMALMSDRYSTLKQAIQNDDAVMNVHLPVNVSADEYIMDNVVYVNVFYADLSVLNIVQQDADSFTSFICDIGGSLGLFIGASILTVFEFIDSCVWFLQKKKGQRHPKAADPTLPQNTSRL